MTAGQLTARCRRVLIVGAIALGLSGALTPIADANGAYSVEVTVLPAPVHAESHERIHVQLMHTVKGQQKAYKEKDITCSVVVRHARLPDYTSQAMTDKNGHLYFLWTVTHSGEAKITVHCGGSNGPNGGLIVHVRP